MSTFLIREVWEENLEQEFAYIREIVEQYPYVSMDTEFPGVVAKPIGNSTLLSEYTYQFTRCNVDLLKVIQIGISFSDKDGNYPSNLPRTWQFNFQFSLENEMYAPDSIDLLRKSGINFKKLEEYGIYPEHFGELLITSGLVLTDEVRWVSFHSIFDFGYLLKLLTCQNLPKTEEDFFKLLNIYFPAFYDIKHLMRSCKSLKGGLQDCADDLQVIRVGTQHQAGSDSLLTAQVFFKMVKTFFEDDVDDKRNLNVLYGMRNPPNFFQAPLPMQSNMFFGNEQNESLAPGYVGPTQF